MSIKKNVRAAENEPAAYAQIIKKLRAETGLNQSKFAAYFEIPKRTIEDWERGARKPPEYVVSMMRRILLAEEGNAKFETLWNDTTGFDKIIKSLRAKTGLSQSKFAAYIGMPKSSLTDWEQGLRKPPKYVFLMMERTLYAEHMLKLPTPQGGGDGAFDKS